jgi:hypothetical protein
MGWSIGYDSKWQRDIGYGVPAFCDHPNCLKEIHRGLSYVCGGEPYGGERGCGLFFCERHRFPTFCESCTKRRTKDFLPTPDHPRWIKHKLRHPSWKQWRDEVHAQVIQEMEWRVS